MKVDENNRWVPSGQKDPDIYLGSPSTYFSREDPVVDLCINGVINGVQHLEALYLMKPGKKILWLNEPRGVIGDFYTWVEHHYALFKCVLTFDQYLLSLNDSFKFTPAGGCWILPKHFSLYEKSKKISMFLSTKNWSEGHIFRRKVYESVKDSVDIFGYGYNPVDYKLTGLRDYKYHIVVENGQGDDYFTEKLIDCFVTGTIPLYWGTKNINRYFVDVPQFNTLDELKVLLENLDSIRYDPKMNFERAMEFVNPDDWIYLHYPELFKGVTLHAL